MDKKKLALLMGALVVAIGTALAARSMFAGAGAPTAQAAAPVQPQGPKVLVAKRGLPVGTIITADAIGYQLWPKEMVQDAYFVQGETDMNSLLGTVVRHAITAGEPVTQGALVAPGDRGFLAAALGPGMRAVTVPVSARTGVGGFVFPGDRVDLLLTQSVNKDGGTLKTAETIVENVRVLATDQATNSTKDDNGHTVVRAFRTVTLEVTPRIAEKIAVSQSIGTLSLALRSIADNQAQLDKAIASGQVQVPDGTSPQDEQRMLTEAESRPEDGPTTFVTGGDVSRFQPKSLPKPADNNAQSSGLNRPTGPTVRVMRGNTVTFVPVSGNRVGAPIGPNGQPVGNDVHQLVGSEAQGMQNTANVSGAATAASAVVG